jgi:hypothetical protein
MKRIWYHIVDNSPRNTKFCNLGGKGGWVLFMAGSSRRCVDRRETGGENFFVPLPMRQYCILPCGGRSNIRGDAGGSEVNLGMTRK